MAYDWRARRARDEAARARRAKARKQEANAEPGDTLGLADEFPGDDLIQPVEAGADPEFDAEMDKVADAAMVDPLPIGDLLDVPDGQVDEEVAGGGDRQMLRRILDIVQDIKDELAEGGARWGA